MDQNERLRLKKQYEQYADAQILAMLGDGHDAFVEGAYSLLQEEAKSRSISLEQVREQETQQPEPREQGDTAVDEIDPETFVEILIINNDADRQSAASIMEGSNIPYHYLNISVSNKELPVSLMVGQRRIEEAIALLRPLNFSASIALW
jgi:hypothetical protein